MVSEIIEAVPLNSPSKAAYSWREGITDKMAAFVEHWTRYRNATQAYKHAYDTANTSYQVCANEGRKLLADPRIQAAIRARQQIASQQSGVDVGWLLQRFLDIATADPRELIGLKVGACRYCHGVDHAYHWREREFLEACEKAEQLARLEPNNPAAVYPDPSGGLDYNATHPPHPDCPQCHGEGVERFVPRDTDTLSDQALLLYGGVKVKKDGYEIVIADREKALEHAGRILGAFNDKLRLSGNFSAIAAVADLRDLSPQDAAKAYRDFIAGHLTAPS